MAERRSAPVMESVANGDEDAEKEEEEEVEKEEEDDGTEDDEADDESEVVVVVIDSSADVDEIAFVLEEDDADGSSGGMANWYRCSADNAASRHSALISAPTKPCVLAAANSMSSSLSSEAVNTIRRNKAVMRYRADICLKQKYTNLTGNLLRSYGKPTPIRF